MTNISKKNDRSRKSAYHHHNGNNRFRLDSSMDTQPPGEGFLGRRLFTVSSCPLKARGYLHTLTMEKSGAPHLDQFIKPKSPIMGQDDTECLHV